MALRSKTSIHSQWPNVTVTTSLPNVTGSPTQSSDLQAGDWCYVAGTVGAAYVCRVATLAAASWDPSSWKQLKLQLDKSTSQTAVGAGVDIAFTITTGNIPWTGTVATLEAGVAYIMQAALFCDTFSNATGGELQYAWVDATTNVALPNGNNGRSQPPTHTGTSGSQPTAFCSFTPSVATTIKLRTTAATGTATVQTNGSFANIARLSPNTVG